MRTRFITNPQGVTAQLPPTNAVIDCGHRGLRIEDWHQRILGTFAAELPQNSISCALGIAQLRAAVHVHLRSGVETRIWFTLLACKGDCLAAGVTGHQSDASLSRELNWNVASRHSAVVSIHRRTVRLPYPTSSCQRHIKKPVSARLISSGLPAV